MDDSLSKKCIDNATKIYCHKHECDGLNINALSRATNVKTTSLWFYLKGKRRWSVDAWLKTLACLGLLKVKKDEIVILTGEKIDLGLKPEKSYKSYR